MTDNDLVGMSLAEVEALSIFVRVVKLDGQACGVTMDHKPHRINVEVENGIITKIASRG